MSSPRSRAKADTRGNPVQSNSDSADLRAKFERDVVSMYDVLYRHAYRMSRSHLALDFRQCDRPDHRGEQSSIPVDQDPYAASVPVVSFGRSTSLPF